MSGPVLDEIRITDDELAAVAVAVGTPCAIRLTTVDETDVDQLSAAVARGRRALAARRLLVADGTAFGRLNAGWLHDFGTAMAADPALVACAVDDNLVPVGGLVQYYLRLPDPTELAVSVVLGGGLHQVLRLPTDVGMDLVLALVDEAATDRDTAARLLLLGRTGEFVRSVLVGRARLLLREAPDEPDLTTHPYDDEGVAEALAWLGLDASNTPHGGTP